MFNLARYKNSENQGDVIIKWMSNKSSFDFYSLWEELFNKNFNSVEFSLIKSEASKRSFTMTTSAV